MTKLLILGRHDVEELLTMPLCIEAIDDAMRALSSKAVIAPLRTFAPIGEERGVLAMMPAATTSPSAFGVKTLSLLPGNPAAGRPAIQGYVALFDQSTGAPVAIVDGVAVTAIRTAAASALATRELARRGAQTHGVLGTGVQAATHAKAILDVWPDIEKTLIWGRTAEKAEALAADLSAEINRPVEAAPLSAVVGCDIVSAATASAEPLIQAGDICPGVHINLVGSHTPYKREASTDVIAAGRLYVDVLSAALKEAGDILIPISEAAIDESHIIGEIGEVLLKRAPGRQSDQDITIYKSLGNAAQDLFAAAAVVDAAKAAGRGQSVVFS